MEATLTPVVGNPLTVILEGYGFALPDVVAGAPKGILMIPLLLYVAITGATVNGWNAPAHIVAVAGVITGGAGVPSTVTVAEF